MCADGGPYIINEVRLDAGTLFHQLFQPVGILDTVPMTDKDDIIFVLPVSQPLLHHIHQLGNGFFPASDFGQGDEMSLIIHMDHGLDVGQCP